MFYAIHLRATNDANGNPRRCFVIFDGDGSRIGAVDEGYNGAQAIERSGLLPKGAEVNLLCQISVPVSEYRDSLRLASNS